MESIKTVLQMVTEGEYKKWGGHMKWIKKHMFNNIQEKKPLIVKRKEYSQLETLAERRVRYIDKGSRTKEFSKC